MQRLWVLAVVAACHRGGGASDECKLVAADPTHAMLKIAQQHKGDPAAAAEVIEACLAPSGDDCERMEKILPALPGMMNMPGAFKMPKNIGEVCKGMPPEMRRCMLPSYSLRHEGECSKVMAKIQDAMMGPLDLAPGHCDKPPVDVAISSNGVGVGSAYRDGELDKDWLETTLHSYAGSGCVPNVIVHAGLGVRYQDMIAAMDMAVKAGLPNVTLEGQGSAQQHPAAPNPNEKSPIVIVTATDITFEGQSLGAPDQPATMVALAKVLPATKDGVLIIQADKDTDSSVINRLVETVSAHGFDNVLFAAKN